MKHKKISIGLCKSCYTMKPLIREEMRKKIEKELKPYKVLDNPAEVKKRGLYEDMAPLSEYAYHQDLGFKKALEWVLNLI